MTQLTGEGFQVDRLDVDLANLEAALQGIFGPDINLDPSSIDGQTIGIFAESKNNLDMLAEAIYQSFNPNTSIGVALSRLVQINGVKRRPGAYSVVSLSLSGTSGIIVPAGNLVLSADGNTKWQTLTDVTLPGTCQAQCTVMGPTGAAPGTLTKPGTPLYGWLTVTNSLAAVPGSYEETDEQLRIRRSQSTTYSAQGVTDAIRGAILNVPDVIECVVYENKSTITDGHSLPAHSINIVVLGGVNQSIWNAIWAKRPTGVTLIGATTGTVIDSAGNPQTVGFDVPTPVQIYVTINMHSLAGFPTGGAVLIQQAIIAWATQIVADGTPNLGIGDKVVWSELFTPINSIPGVSVDSMFIGTSATPTLTANIAIAFNAIAVFTAANIVVNVTS